MGREADSHHVCALNIALMIFFSILASLRIYIVLATPQLDLPKVARWPHGQAMIAQPSLSTGVKIRICDIEYSPHSHRLIR